MFVANGDHGGQDAGPGLWLLHGFVGKHTAIPADVLEFPGSVAVAVAHPEAGMVSDLEFAVGIVRQAMAPRLVMGARALHGRVILGHVEIDRPRTKRSGE